MNQNDWSSLLASYLYTEAFMQGWQNADRSGDPYWLRYEEALNIYLASRDNRRRLTERYASLNDSLQRFQRLKKQGDDHLTIHLGLIRIHADLGDQEAVVSECQRLLEKIPWLQEELPVDEQINIDRPFIAPLSDDDHRNITNGLNDWLRTAIREILKRFDLMAANNLNCSTENSAPPKLRQPQNSEFNADFQKAFHKNYAAETDLLPQEKNHSVASFRQSIGLDRNNLSAYLGYARILSETNKHLAAWLTFSEAKRLTPLSPSDQKMMGDLDVDLSSPDVQQYLERAGEVPIVRSKAPKKILVITNLLPPQEMGGFGRTVWEFCRALIQRGHELKILTADMPHLYREASEDISVVEQQVARDLRLFGDWRDGRTVADTNRALIHQKLRHNHQRILAEVERFQPDGCLVGNLDFVGHEFLDPILQQGIPVVHRLGNSLPGYPVEATPQSRLYCLAGATEWLNLQLKAKGYVFPNQAVIYPASTLETYYRYYPPTFDTLRICFAGLLMPYKGAQILVQSLAILQNQGVPFTCELAGDTTDPSFVESLVTTAEREGFAERLRLTGFLSRKELAALYARSNVIVFPSLFDEPFGKSQIEAMAAGLVVVSSGTGGAREIITDGKNGWIFERGNAEDLATKLMFLHHNPNQTQEVAARGHEDAFRFTTIRSIEKIERLFEILSVIHSNFPLAPAPILSLPRQKIMVGRTISDVTILVDIEELDEFAFSDSAGIAVLMPTIDIEKAKKTALILEKRAGIKCRIILIHDRLRQGFIKTINAAFRRIDAKYIVYLAEDSYPGRGWLKCAYLSLEQSGKGLFAFNDGKWFGSTASFGMVRRSWIAGIYENSLFFSGYVSHAGDTEISVIARASDQLVYNPNCVLTEVDYEKDTKGIANLEDDLRFKMRFVNYFCGLVSPHSLKKFAAQYGVTNFNNKERIFGIQNKNEVLEHLHKQLKPQFYLEIGVQSGRSLQLAQCPSLGIDPAPQISVELSEHARVLRMTSDEFFEKYAEQELNTPPNLIFIDGMHLFEYALRDFINVERIAAPNAIVIIDDVLPCHPDQAKRARETQNWTGDVWKVYETLKNYRPDLHLQLLNVAPTGFLLVAGLDSKNSLLSERYDEILAQWPENAGPPFSILTREAAKSDFSL